MKHLKFIGVRYAVHRTPIGNNVQSHILIEFIVVCKEYIDYVLVLLSAFEFISINK